MADITLTSVPWPPTTSVGAYARTTTATPSGAPPGSAVQTKAVAANFSLTFTGLAAGDYWAAALLGGDWEYVAFRAEAAAASGGADRDNGQPGMYAPSALGWNTSLTAPTPGRATFARFVPSRNMTIASIAFCVTTLGADVACDVGIYSSDLQTRLGASTAATGRLNSTGVKNVALVTPVSLVANTVYYAAFSCDMGSTAIVTFAVYNGASTAAMFGATAGKVEVDFKATSHPLPATLTVTGFLGGVPLLALRES